MLQQYIVCAYALVIHAGYESREIAEKYITRFSVTLL